MPLPCRAVLCASSTNLCLCSTFWEFNLVTTLLLTLHLGGTEVKVHSKSPWCHLDGQGQLSCAHKRPAAAAQCSGEAPAPHSARTDAPARSRMPAAHGVWHTCKGVQPRASMAAAETPASSSSSMHKHRNV